MLGKLLYIMGSSGAAAYLAMVGCMCVRYRKPGAEHKLIKGMKDSHLKEEEMFLARVLKALHGKSISLKYGGNKTKLFALLPLLIPYSALKMSVLLLAFRRNGHCA